MDPKDFPQPAGELVQRLSGEQSYWAFVPASLPPALTFDSALAGSIGAARGALGELAGLGRALPNPDLLIRPFIQREALSSSRIEGTRADLSDLFAYESGQLLLPGLVGEPASEPHVRDVLNYMQALQQGLEQIKTLPVSLRLIRDLHRKLMTGARGEHQARPGEFRRGQNMIVGSGGETLTTARFVPTPPDELQQALNAFEAFVHTGVGHDPLVRLALLHYQFEAIHPFGDGNGRIGRLLITLLLVDWELLPLPLLYLSDYFEAHRREYNDLLLAVSQRSAWAEWVQFFLRGIHEKSNDAVMLMRHLQDLQIQWRNQVSVARHSALLPKLIDSLFQNPVLSIPMAQRTLNVTYRAAKLNVDKLIGLGVLRPIGDTTYGKAFLAEAIWKALHDGPPSQGV